MSKFKTGDRIRITNIDGTVLHPAVGEEGTISYVSQEEGSWYPYRVMTRNGDDFRTRWRAEGELELIEEDLPI